MVLVRVAYSSVKIIPSIQRHVQLLVKLFLFVDDVVVAVVVFAVVVSRIVIIIICRTSMVWYHSTE